MMVLRVIQNLKYKGHWMCFYRGVENLSRILQLFYVPKESVKIFRPLCTEVKSDEVKFHFGSKLSSQTFAQTFSSKTCLLEISFILLSRLTSIFCLKICLIWSVPKQSSSIWGATATFHNQDKQLSVLRKGRETQINWLHSKQVDLFSRDYF